MEVIIASDIFGRTKEQEDIVVQLSTNVSAITLVDPYAGKDHAFNNEEEAYSYFQQDVGIEAYIDTVFEATASKRNSVFLIGFSIGASALWAISDKLRGQAKAMCFYGSQIRHFQDIKPNISMDLIFPAHEPHFNLDQLISHISLNKNVLCQRDENLHGFMNKRSINFNKPAYEKYLECIKEKLTQL